MKKLLVFIAISLPLYALNQTTNFYPLTGSVGIGTTSPSASTKLHIVGSSNPLLLQTTSSAGNNYIYFDNPSGHMGFIGYGSGSLNTLHIYNSSPSSGIEFGTTSISRMTISSNGNVGIGTTNPNTTLEVDGIIRLTSFKHRYLQIGASETSDNFGYISSAGQSNGTGLKLETTSSGSTIDGVTRMTI